jgi:hypothetical protein
MPQRPKSAKGADARRHTAKKLAGPLGGALDTAPVLREFLQSRADRNEILVRVRAVISQISGRWKRIASMCVLHCGKKAEATGLRIRYLQRPTIKQLIYPWVHILCCIQQRVINLLSI